MKYNSILIALLSIVLLSQEKVPVPNEIDKPVQELSMRKNTTSVLPGNGYQTDAMQSRVFIGQAAGDNFGSSAVSAGDVNGDGYDDIIVGSPLNDAGGTDAGRAYVYFGGRAMDNVPDVVLTSGSAGENYGYSVAAGDVNNDGYSDVVVGAPIYGSGAGRVYVYFGGPSMDNSADAIITAGSVNDLLGVSVACGDVNGDGKSDIIIGAPGYDSYTGRTYIIYGGSSLSSWINAAYSNIIITGEAPSYFGISVAAAGDLNGDGISDIVIGASYFNSLTGRIYIIFGRTNFQQSIFAGNANLIQTGESTTAYFGCSVAGAGDINGDGFGDVIAGASGQGNTGKAYIFYGGSTMNNVWDIEISGVYNGDQLGSSVNSAGDINGDGYGDIVIGSPGTNSSAGRAYIFYGSAAPDNRADGMLNGELTNGAFGNTAGCAGDVNGDGYDDIIAGANMSNSGRGSVYIYTNSMTGTDFADLTFTGSNSNQYLGYGLTFAGDINGDGKGDFIIGSPGRNGAGGISVFFGKSVPSHEPDMQINSAINMEGFGNTIAAIGDVNGDGYADFAVGATDYSGGTGRVCIFFGGTAINSQPDLVLTGEAQVNYFGTSISGGDINGDGFSDVVVGAPEANGGIGRGYLYFGGPAMDNVYDLLLTNLSGFAAVGDRIGTSIDASSDLNGDGYADIVMGIPNCNTSRGEVYIYLGRPVPYRSPDYKISGLVDNGWFGSSISTGDFNGDSYADLAIGSPSYSSSTGRVDVFYGGPNFSSQSAFSISYMLNSLFGKALSMQGDLNSDGYADLVVGVPRVGKAFVYFGNAISDSTADVALTGPINSTLGFPFGYFLAAGGDVNGDGQDDLLISNADYNGAPGNYANAGKAFLYLSSAPIVKPRITSIADSPNDQGGKVMINFARSGYDVDGINRIQGYLIQRSAAGQSNANWEDVVTVTPRKQSNYLATVNTLADSVIYFYRLRALTANASEYWNSNIKTGMSIDNLAPSAVKNLSLKEQGSTIRLSWTMNTETDFKQHLVYRSNSPVLNALAAEPLARVVDSVFVDNTPLTGEVYYFVAAQDIHNNISPIVSSPGPNAAVNLSMFIEGLYDAAAGRNRIADTIMAFLRASTSPYIKLDSCKAILSVNGLAQLKFFNIPSGRYYLVVKHRNSLETWSKQGGETVAKGSTVSYDFTAAAASACGSNLKQIGSRWCIYSGDVNQDGLINYNDVNLLDADMLSYAAGYLSTDLNGDSVVDFSDMILCDNNYNAHVHVVSPESIYKSTSPSTPKTMNHKKEE